MKSEHDWYKLGVCTKHLSLGCLTCRRENENLKRKQHAAEIIIKLSKTINQLNRQIIYCENILKEIK